MKRVLIGILRRLAFALSVPVILSEFFDRDTGREYGVKFLVKIKLALKMSRNYRKIQTGSRVIEHLVMATRILRVPKSVEGCVVECGSFKGGSATNLSLVCALCGRDLEIFDSFAGLPEPSGADKEHVLVGLHQVHTYTKGAWGGTLEEVKGNIRRYGIIDRCHFNVGYFADTLPHFRRRVVFTFLDVDLTESLQTCLRYLWPLIHDGCNVFTHEAPHMEIASAFFSESWWCSSLHCKPPGLVGAGTGLGLLPTAGGFKSDLGYTVKNPQLVDFRIDPQTGLE
ncbi:MAG: TylF/MycF/NovP-related O-methyltransferase [Terracidiphilus sp.]